MSKCYVLTEQDISVDVSVRILPDCIFCGDMGWRYGSSWIDHQGRIHTRKIKCNCKNAPDSIGTD